MLKIPEHCLLEKSGIRTGDKTDKMLQNGTENRHIFLTPGIKFSDI